MLSCEENTTLQLLFPCARKIAREVSVGIYSGKNKCVKCWKYQSWSWSYGKYGENGGHSVFALEICGQRPGGDIKSVRSQKWDTTATAAATARESIKIMKWVDGCKFSKMVFILDIPYIYILICLHIIHSFLIALLCVCKHPQCIGSRRNYNCIIWMLKKGHEMNFWRFSMV